MCKLLLQDLVTIISQPLKRKIDQRAIERWASGFWKLKRQCTPIQCPDKQPYVMMFPPPNITGSLHLGHALTGAIQDAIVRHKRMQGHRCVFIPGFDHAGLATQNVVEKNLWKRRRITKRELGRESFVHMVNSWKDQKRSQMRNQLNRLGLELDHKREYFTMDTDSSIAVQAAFKQLFENGIIYRSIKPIFWSEELQTTLSDIEVEKIAGVDTYTRTGEIVERRPISQWFIKAEAMSEMAIEVVRNGSVEMIPSNYKNSWYSWLREGGTEDWCISRQSWWGHRIPAYRLASAADDQSNWIVADSLNEAKSLLAHHSSSEVVQDPDVLDTWFSSSLLPLIISGWPDSEKFSASCNQGRFPLQMMETGFDILTFWVSKMTMMSLSLTSKIPFRLVLLHGMICDSDGKKMSKSRGNVIDPLDVIDGASLCELQKRIYESNSQGILDDSKLQPVLDNQKRLFPSGVPECGADGLRAYLLSHDVFEEIVKIQINQIDRIRRLMNKIWNVYRFVVSLKKKGLTDGSLKIDDSNITSLSKNDLDKYDKQLLSALAECIETSHQVFNESYLFHRCLGKLELFWVVHLSHEYIESSKDVLLAVEEHQQKRKRKFEVLYISLITSIKLLHPFMPHLTEFLYQKLNLLDIEGNNADLINAIENCYPLSHQPFPRVEDWSEFHNIH